VPTQDIILVCYYLSLDRDKEPGEYKEDPVNQEASPGPLQRHGRDRARALCDVITLHSKIKARCQIMDKDGKISTVRRDDDAAA